MTDEDVLAEFRAAGALLEGHFILSSGRRSGNYLQCARVLMNAERAGKLARAMVQKLGGRDLVVAVDIQHIGPPTQTGTGLAAVDDTVVIGISGMKGGHIGRGGRAFDGRAIKAARPEPGAAAAGQSRHKGHGPAATVSKTLIKERVIGSAHWDSNRCRVFGAVVA